MVSRSEKLPVRRRLVLAYADSVHAARSGRHFRRQGWQVHPAGTAAEARRLTAALDPDLVVLDADLPDESGWLVCAKLRLGQPDRKIILVNRQYDPEKIRLGDFVGAAAVLTRDGLLAAILDEMMETRVPA